MFAILYLISPFQWTSPCLTSLQTHPSSPEPSLAVYLNADPCQSSPYQSCNTNTYSAFTAHSESSTFGVAYSADVACLYKSQLALLSFMDWSPSVMPHTLRARRSVTPTLWIVLALPHSQGARRSVTPTLLMFAGLHIVIDASSIDAFSIVRSLLRCLSYQ